MMNWVGDAARRDRQPRAAAGGSSAAGPRRSSRSSEMSAIVVDGVSKRFRLQTDRAHSVKELVTRRDRNAGVDQFWALRDVSLEIPRGLDVRPRRPQRLGQVDAAALHRGDLPADGGVGQRQRPDLDPARAGRRVPPGPDRARERLHERHHPRACRERQIDARFDEIVEFAGIEEFIDSPVKIYSSGMYIRLGFSVAVHVDPEILIVDEVIAVGRRGVPAEVLRPPLRAAQEGRDDRGGDPRSRHRRVHV